MRASTALQPQQLYFRKCCRTNGLSNILRRRRGERCRQTFTNPLRRQNPIVQALCEEYIIPVRDPKQSLLYGVLTFVKGPALVGGRAAARTHSKCC